MDDLLSALFQALWIFCLKITVTQNALNKGKHLSMQLIVIFTYFFKILYKKNSEKFEIEKKFFGGGRGDRRQLNKSPSN